MSRAEIGDNRLEPRSSRKTVMNDEIPLTFRLSQHSVHRFKFEVDAVS